MLNTVIVGGIPIHRVNVHGGIAADALRRKFDQPLRSLKPAQQGIASALTLRRFYASFDTARLAALRFPTSHFLSPTLPARRILHVPHPRSASQLWAQVERHMFAITVKDPAVARWLARIKTQRMPVQLSRIERHGHSLQILRRGAKNAAHVKYRAAYQFVRGRAEDLHPIWSLQKKVAGTPGVT